MGGSTRPGESQGSIAAADAAAAAAAAAAGATGASGGGIGGNEALKRIEASVKEASSLLQEAEACLDSDRPKAVGLCQRALTAAAAAATATTAAATTGSLSVLSEVAISDGLKDISSSTDATGTLTTPTSSSSSSSSSSTISISRSSNELLLTIRESALRVYEEGVVWLAGVYAEAGILHAQDKDYRTAFSYFYEAFEAFSNQEATHETQRRHDRAAAAAAAAAQGGETAAAAAGATAAAGDKRFRNSEERELAVRALSYMLLTKILMGRPEDVPQLLTNRYSLRYYVQPVAGRSVGSSGIVSSLSGEERGVKNEDIGIVSLGDDPNIKSKNIILDTDPDPEYDPDPDPDPDPDTNIINEEINIDPSDTASARLEFLRLLAISRKEKSLNMFRRLLRINKWVLNGDNFLEENLNELYNKLIEEDLYKKLNAFSCVELNYISKLINLPEKEIENKLSTMLLDNKLNGTLDQGRGVLILYPQQHKHLLYDHVLSTLTNMASVVDALYEKAQQTL
ncbi:proteasome PCI domain-containing protein, putative [Eimeria maxima]|uniref:Proteasome PCI domain-containing protein, putative n=1 Tax=Eimeria maxima TaxID=5804 RepID=U6LZ28_EIMMA|nr:proteasome PCI domain-containing protein, putative [Eimeria maxima]CDJ57011.1 proteasome PCI domain-containing protein, putative [Eimeria maxima]